MRTFFLLLMILPAVIFAVQNAGLVTIRLLAWRFEASLAIAVCFVLGAACGILIALPRLYRMRAHQKRLRALLAELDADERDGAHGAPAPDSSLRRKA